jgi:hypothetical protein
VRCSVSAEHPHKAQCFHLCIVNLVIGTLYCAKGNYEFGISRVIKSLEPYDKKLGTDTWCVLVTLLLALRERYLVTATRPASFLSSSASAFSAGTMRSGASWA